MTDKEKLFMAIGFIQGLASKGAPRDEQNAKEFIKMLDVEFTAPVKTDE